jgi:hypothetical protein
MSHGVGTIASLLAILSIQGGCAPDGSPERVADAFADAYFRRMDQEKAKDYTALGASSMLDSELHEVAQIRKDGYTPSEAAAEIVLRRGPASQRDQRVRFPFEVVVKVDGAETIRDADVELTQIQGVWKVVRVGVKAR